MAENKTTTAENNASLPLTGVEYIRGVQSGENVKFQVQDIIARGFKSPLTTKGDLVTYDTITTRLPVGTDGQGLIADSTQATGLSWSSRFPDFVNTLSGSTGASQIGYLAFGTGSILRSVSSKLQDTITAKDYGAISTNTNSANKTALQSAINAVQSSGNYGLIQVPADVNYGVKTTDPSTWPSFTSSTSPVTIIDSSVGNTYSGFPTAYDGAQVRQWMYTPQTTSPGQHDGNTHWLRGAWAPAYCISNDSNLANPSTGASDNRRAATYYGSDGTLNWAVGQGTKSGAGYTPTQLAWFKIAGFVGAFAGGSNALVIDTDTGNVGWNTDPAESFHAKSRTAGYRAALFESNTANTAARLALRPGSANGGSSLDVEFSNFAGVATIAVAGSNVFTLGATAGSIGAGTHTVTSASSYVHTIQNLSSTTGFGLKIASTTAAGNGFALIDGYAGTTTKVFSVLGNGNVVNTNNSYGAISAAKFKDIIGSAPSYWDKVKALGKSLKKYTLKADPEKNVLLGGIAEEWREIAPGLIDETDDLNESHEPLGTTTLSVKYSVAHLMALGALSEAMSRIEALEEKLKINSKLI